MAGRLVQNQPASLVAPFSAATRAHLVIEEWGIKPPAAPIIVLSSDLGDPDLMQVPNPATAALH